MLNLFRLHRDRSGFTLIELVIIIAILGIIAAVAIPKYAVCVLLCRSLTPTRHW